ncbi:MAG TPA: group II intron reverse transcriptase/maturase [Gemmataceae bacterium]|nr:group II intron reverse transcriptase/maturase [Gemmataceae bacterium]
MPVNDGWNTLPWFTLERELFRLQTRIYRASMRGDVPSVRKLQKLLLSGEAARLIAVRRVTQDNMGKKSAGVDGVKLVPPECRPGLAASLRLDGEAAPVRRVHIPKPGSEELRPLGIPTIRDRALQTLVRLALEPEWEARFEPNSYGFRPGRSCWDAVQAIYITVRWKAKYVLDADIAKCFDRIDHEALLDKVSAGPTVARQLRAWLKAGVLDGETLFPSDRGTPQGGAISPLLANIALHGLEDLVRRRFPARTVNGERHNTATLIRYADDFVVIHAQEGVVREAQEVIAGWLRGMGLELKPSKTRIGHTLDEVGGRAGFDFLGFTVRQFPAGAARSACNDRGRPPDFVTLIKPSREAVRRQVASLREIVAGCAGAPQAALISRLNPVIRGWSNYYSTQVSKAIFHALDRTLTRMLLRWAYRRHGRRPRGWVVREYWDIVPGQTWAFRCRQKDFRLRRHDDTRIVRHVKVQGTRSPFDGNWLYWSARLGRHPGVVPSVAKLLKRQGGKCAWCGLFFRHGDVWNVDHVVPKSHGGTDAMDNLQLLHRHCHQRKHGSSPCPGIGDNYQATEEPDARKPARPVLKPSGGSDPFA